MSKGDPLGLDAKAQDAGKSREGVLMELLQSYTGQEVAGLVVELLTIRRERYRDKLERQESPEHRGRAKECKDLLQIFD